MDFDKLSFRSYCIFLSLALSAFLSSCSASNAIDMNNNGVSDVWETHYPAAAQNLLHDTDSDGTNNMHEGISWTDPTNPLSKVDIENLSIDASTINFSWHQTLGPRYSVLRSYDLIDWEHKTKSTTGKSDNKSLSDTIQENAFYRLKIESALNSDTDGLTNREEHELGTNPESWDTDGDKVPDDIEFNLGLNPLLWVDNDKDTIPDDWEYWIIHSDATDEFVGLSDVTETTDFDGDTILDGQEFLLGTSPVKALKNILLFLTEDQSPHLGILGSVGLETPNLDRFANNGVNFTRGFSLSPVCSPSKMALFTGTHPHENGGYQNVKNSGVDIFPINIEENDPSTLDRGGVHEDLPTLIEVLRDRGWFTAISSKSHVQPVRKFPYHFGFGANVSYPRNPQDVASYVNQTVQLAGDRPFFLCLNIAAPHLPFRTIANYNGLWDPQGGLLGDGGVTNVDPYKIEVPNSLPDLPPVRQDIADYYGAIEIIDDCFGAAEESLAINNLLEETLIIFTSDHGIGLARFKQSIYGHHVPLLVSGPEIEGNRTIKEPVSHLDLMPTILDFAGIPKLPSLKGKSLIPIFKGNNELDGRNTILTACHERYDARAVCDGKYYYIQNIRQVNPTADNGQRTGFNNPHQAINADQFMAGHPWYNRSFNATKGASTSHQYELLRQILEGDLPAEELYDLDIDPWCTNNLVEDKRFKEIKSNLYKELVDWRIKTNDYNSHPKEIKRRIDRYTLLPGTRSEVTKIENFNNLSGSLNSADNWETLIYGNDNIDFVSNNGHIDSPRGDLTLSCFKENTNYKNGTRFTIKVNTGFSGNGVGAGIAFGVKENVNDEYSFWQFMIVDGRTLPVRGIDVCLKRINLSDIPVERINFEIDSISNYPNGFFAAPSEYFKIIVKGQVGTPYVDLIILNPDESIYFDKYNHDLGQAIPENCYFGITTWSSSSALFDNYETYKCDF